MKTISAAAILAVLASGAAANDLALFGVESSSSGAAGVAAGAVGVAGPIGGAAAGFVVAGALFEENSAEAAVGASTDNDYLFNQQSVGGQSVTADMTLGNFSGTYGNKGGYSLDVKPGDYDMDMGNKIIIDIANSASNSVNSFVADATVGLAVEACDCGNLISQQSMSTEFASTAATMKVGNFDHTIGVDISNAGLGSANSITIEQTEINLAGISGR